MIRFYKNYNISTTVIIKKKLSQQYVNLFEIIQKIENLIYKLMIFDT